MANIVTTRIGGLQDLRRQLLDLAPRLRRRALRNALAAGARAFRDEAKRLAPVLKLSTYSGASAVRRGVRKVGTLRNAIRVRTSKLSTRRGDVGVFVNVKPLKGGGAKNPNDPYYWRFVEFGTRRSGEKTFLRAAAARKSGEALRRFEQSIGPQLKRLNVKGAVL